MATPDVSIAKWVGHPRSFTKGRKSGQPSVIVIHTTEGSEGGNSAENGAAYDKRRTDGTSTHYFIDANSVVQEVEHKDEAHAARSKGNDIGIQLETCGKAGQTASQWADDDSAATLNNLARLCAEIRKTGNYPLSRLSSSELRAAWNGGKVRGFAGHVDITKAFPEDRGTHTDPGPNFPWTWLFKRIKELEGNVPQKVHPKIDLDGNLYAEVKFGDDDRDFEGNWMVMRLQRLLYYKADGKTLLTPDGRYGNDTKAAVKAKLTAAKMSGDGSKVGLAEWRVIAGFYAG
jgi:N-acetyl-anhydromuramyl-L-alanine amidase AmpD